MLAPMTHPLENVPLSYGLGERWFVFTAEPGREKAAEESIRELGFQAFVPCEKRIRRVRNRRVEREYALFSGYGFVRFDINRDPWGAIVGAKWVFDLLRMDRVPQAVPDKVVDGLHVAISAGAFDHTKPPNVGMPVEITEGPFASIIGKIKRARTNERMDVLLTFLGTEIVATVPLLALREA